MNPKTTISQELLESVERYLNKNMPIKELQEFERKIVSNTEFKLQVEDIKTLLLGIETQSLKEQLNVFHDDLKEANSTKKGSSKIISFSLKKIIAAALIIISACCLWFFNQPSSNEKLFSQYFYPDPGLPTTMSETTNYEFYNAMVDYKQGNYGTAISKWDLLLKNKPKNDTLNYFVGVAYLANKEEKKATKHLDLVTKKLNSNFKNEAFYYLGLAYLKADNLELAKKNLTFSTVDNSKTILSKLND